MVNVGRSWTAQEDQQLIQAVAVHGDNTEKWKTIALSVPGRTNKACRKRWLHSLSPFIKKTAWTQDEDQLLISLYAKYNTKWAAIARHIPGRTDDACSKRYREALDPSLKKHEWTNEEDVKLLESYGRLGGKWGQVGQELQRSGLGCRNRWRLLERKRNAASRQQPATTVDGPTESCGTPGTAWPTMEETEPLTYWCHSLDSQRMCNALTGYVENADGQAHTGHLVISDDIFSSIDHDPDIHDTPPIDGSSLPCPLPFSYTSSSLSAALSELPATEGRPHSHRPSLTIASAQIHPPQQLPESGSVSPSEDTSLSSTHSDDACGTVDKSRNDTPPSSDPSISSNEHVVTASQSQETSIGGLPMSDVPVNQGHPGGFQFVHVSDPTPEVRKRRRLNRPGAQPIDFGADSDRNGPPRLSSTLPVQSDLSLLAYACGHSKCWPINPSDNPICFATSGELSDHFKDAHSGERFASSDMPFRCGLERCRKGWKSINGLQYHLQISKAHFRNALAVTLPSTRKDDDTTPAPHPTSSSTVTRPKKVYRCPQPDCRNEYKQLSGLRYHLAHGHPADQPAQLDTVPPALARRFARGSPSS